MLERSPFRVLLVAALALTLTACQKQELVQDLDQRQAHEVVSTLFKSGIQSEVVRGRGASASFRVDVAAADFGKAVTLLQERGLPSVAEPSFSELVAERSFLPKSRDFERLRIDHALSKQIEETLRSYPQVRDAKVIIRSSYPKEASSPTASIVVLRATAAEVDEEELKQLVLRSVPSLLPDSIFVKQAIAAAGVSEEEAQQLMNEALVPFAFGVSVAEKDYSTLLWICLSLAGVVGLVGLFIGYWLGYINQPELVTDSPDELPAITSSQALQLDQGSTKIREL